jgi:hypothetical protein
MTTDPADDDDADASGGFLAHVAHFDWLKIPGAVRAIAQVVLGTGQAASAWIDVVRAGGEKRAQAIRDDTAARTKVTAAFAKAISQTNVNDPKLRDRALIRFMGEEFTKQENREAIAVKAVELLDENPPDKETDGPSPDWLNVFSSHASMASSETLRQHWAQILAGEIRKPGSFSLATLQVLSIVDTKIAKAITTVRPWIVNNDWIPVIGALRVGLNYRLLTILDSSGFLRVGSWYGFGGADDTPTLLNFYRTAILAKPSGRQIMVPGALITLPGQEMLSIVPPAEDPQMIQHIAQSLKPYGFAKVQIGIPVVENGKFVRLDGARDV